METMRAAIKKGKVTMETIIIKIIKWESLTKGGHLQFYSVCRILNLVSLYLKGNKGVGSVEFISTKLTNLLSLEQFNHKACKLGGDELHRPPWWP